MVPRIVCADSATQYKEEGKLSTHSNANPAVVTIWVAKLFCLAVGKSSILKINKICGKYELS